MVENKMKKMSKKEKQNNMYRIEKNLTILDAQKVNYHRPYCVIQIGKTILSLDYLAQNHEACVWI